MWWLLLIPVLLLACVLLWGVLTASLRAGRMDTRTALEAGKGPWKPAYRAQMLAGLDWLEAQETENVCIRSRDGLLLRGIFLPRKDPRGTVLLLHGYRSSAGGDFSCIFRDYYEAGFQILAAEQRAMGQSEGRFITFGVRERFDAVDWTRFLDKKTGGLPVILNGISMGATTALMAAGSGLGENVKGIVADCGFTSPEAIIRRVMKKRFHLPAFLLPLFSFTSRIVCGFGYRDYSTLDAMKQNTIPVLFLHGLSDSFVPSSMTRENFAACKSEKQAVFVENAGHGESYVTDKASCQRALKDFLDRYAPQIS